jgi:hypothetical protein
MNNNEYYVMFYDFEDPTASVYETIISNYKTSHTDAIIYKVDLSKGFNQPYISETSNVNVSKINDLKIKGPTLIKIKNGSNVSYGEGKDVIKNILK